MPNLHEMLDEIRMEIERLQTEVETAGEARDEAIGEAELWETAHDELISLRSDALGDVIEMIGAVIRDLDLEHQPSERQLRAQLRFIEAAAQRGLDSL